MQKLNLDVNASYGLRSSVLALLRGGDSAYLNPSSIHSGGQAARARLDEARERILHFLRAKREDYKVVFTSGATEANNAVIYSETILRGKISRGVLTSNVEHPSVLEPCRRVEKLGVHVSYLSPPRSMSESESWASKIDTTTGLVSLMYANNETGEIFDVQKLFSQLRKINPNIVIHCDTVQALGKTEFNLPDVGADVISISGHKIGALSGIGALVIRKGVAVEPLLCGGTQEERFRAGTQNVLGAISFGIAAEDLSETLSSEIITMNTMTSRLTSRIQSELTDVILTIKDLPRLPNTVHLRIPGVPSDDFVVAMDLDGICISSGAACASGKPEPSHVLLAMGVSPEHAKESVRISVRGDVTEQEIDFASDAFVRAVIRMRRVHG